MNDIEYLKSCPRVHAFFERRPDMLPIMRVQCPDGWDAAVGQALEELAALADETGHAVRLVQVKEKLAGLRIYARMDYVPSDPADTHDYGPGGRLLGHDEEPGTLRARVAAIIRAAEARCEVACEECGAPGRVHSGGPISVLCDAHFAKYMSAKQ